MASLPVPGAPALHVFDLSGYVFRAYHAIKTPLTSPSGEPTHAVMGTLTMVQRVLAERRPVHVVVAMDSRAPSFRKEQYAEYKANRPPPPPDLSVQMERCRELCEAYGLPVAQQEGIEADDIIATVVRRFDGPVVILSADKDLMQLVSERVVLWDTMRSRVYGPLEVKDKLGILPEAVRDYLALVGDASDNVPGVPHVGPKTAVELLEQFGSLTAVYEGLERVARPRIRETLEEHRAEAFLSQDLVTLKDDVDVPWTTERRPPDVAKLRRLFTELGFGRLLAKLPAEEPPDTGAASPRDREPSSSGTPTGEPARAASPTPTLEPARAASPTPTLEPARAASPTPTLEPARAASPTPTLEPARATASSSATDNDHGGDTAFRGEPNSLHETATPPPHTQPPSPPAGRAAPLTTAVTAQPTAVLSDPHSLHAAVEQARAAPAASFHVFDTHHEPMRADVVGFAFAWGDHSAYVPVGHRVLDAAPQLPLAEALDALAPLLAASRRLILHDAKHAMVVLARHGVTLRTASVFDVMLAAFLLDPEARTDLDALAETTLGRAIPPLAAPPARGRPKAVPLDEQPVDVVAPRAHAIARALLDLSPPLDDRLVTEGLSDLLTQVDVPLSATLAAMERAGVRVDPARLAALGAQVDAELQTVEARAYEAAGRAFNLASPRQLEALLFDEFKLRVVKRTKTSRSTDAEVLEELSGEHRLPGVVLEHRQLAKLKGTYIDALPLLIHPKTGRIHTTFAQAVAATGRLSSLEPNLQNIPIRTELGRAIRSAFVPEPGRLLVSADYSQIELRVLAHLSEDPVLVKGFSRGEDVHTRTAMELFDKTDSEILPDERRVAKTINFGVIYGMGESALAKRLGVPRKEAAGFITRYFARYQGIRRFLDEVVATARATGSVQTMAGRRRFLPDLSSGNRALRLQAERIAQNTPIQGTAADILKAAMLALTEPVVPGAQMILTVHDELVFEVPEALVEAAAGRIERTMSDAWALRVPLVVQVGWGKDWGAAH